MPTYRNGGVVLVSDQVVGLINVDGRGDVAIAGRVVRVADHAPERSPNVLVAWLDWSDSKRVSVYPVGTAPDGVILIHDHMGRHECRTRLTYAHASKLKKVG